jgi:UDP-glucuronate 4-epimerase
VATVLVTGAAGFIGHALCKRLLARGDAVTGVDALTPYYDVTLKRARLAELTPHASFQFQELDLARREQADALFDHLRPRAVVHLAAQPGVRYSIENPHAYVDANVMGFLNVLEGARLARPDHLVYASSSSVYGGNTKVPFSVGDAVDHPVSLYAATKKANELMAHVYSHLYGLPTTGLRFFTVYGPWGRPDMAPMLFTKAIMSGEPIKVFNHGTMKRDFTYVDDIVEGVVRVLNRPPHPGDPSSSANAVSSGAPYRVYNIGNSAPVDLLRFIQVLEDLLGRKAEKVMVGMQPGDVPATFAEVADLQRDVGFHPATSIEDGLARMVAWYKEYYRVS